VRVAIRLRWQLHVAVGDCHRGVSKSGGLGHMFELHTSLNNLRLRHRIYCHNLDEAAKAVPGHSRLVQGKVILGDGMPNIPGWNDVLVLPSPYPDFCCAIVASRSCHRLVIVDIDLSLGRVRVCHRESPGFDGVACPAIIGCQMVPGRAARGER